jgi:hypothetical protein
LTASSWSLSSLPSTHFFSVIIILLRLTRASSLTFCSKYQYKLVRVSYGKKWRSLRLTSWGSQISIKSFESLLVHCAKCYSKNLLSCVVLWHQMCLHRDQRLEYSAKNWHIFCLNYMRLQLLLVHL